MALSMRKNSSVYSESRTNQFKTGGNLDAQTVILTDIVQLDNGGKLDFFAYQGNGGGSSRNVEPGSTNTFVTIQRI
jgi:hypothetical protein